MKDKFNKNSPKYFESQAVTLDEVFPQFEILQTLCAKLSWGRSYARQLKNQKNALKIEGMKMLNMELSYPLTETQRVECFYKQMKESDKLDAVIRKNFEWLHYAE